MNYITLESMGREISIEALDLKSTAPLGKRGINLNDVATYRRKNAKWMSGPKFNTVEKRLKAAVSECEEIYEAYKEKTSDDVYDECGDAIMALLGLWEDVGVIDYQKAFERGFDKLHRRITVLKEGGDWADAKAQHPK